MMDDMVSHHWTVPAPLHSGVLLTAYTLVKHSNIMMMVWSIQFGSI
jgi:hypothetical protein